MDGRLVGLGIARPLNFSLREVSCPEIMSLGTDQQFVSNIVRVMPTFTAERNVKACGRRPLHSPDALGQEGKEGSSLRWGEVRRDERAAGGADIERRIAEAHLSGGLRSQLGMPAKLHELLQ